MNTDDQEPVDDSVSSADAARLLAVTPDAILRKLRTGKLRPGVAHGRGLWVSRLDVEEERRDLLRRLDALDARQVSNSVTDDRRLEDVVFDLNRQRTRDLARIRELEETGRGLAEMLEISSRLVAQRLVSDTLND